jgi:hypothetical protein
MKTAFRINLFLDLIVACKAFCSTDLLTALVTLGAVGNSFQQGMNLRQLPGRNLSEAQLRSTEQADNERGKEFSHSVGQNIHR